MEIKWYKTEDNKPELIGYYLCAIATDDGNFINILKFDGDDFLHDGEYCFQHGYYFDPVYWSDYKIPLPEDM